MRHVVLADTGPLYAAVDPSDQHHQRAQQQIERLAAEERDVVVLFPTLSTAERTGGPAGFCDTVFNDPQQSARTRRGSIPRPSRPG